MDDCAVYDVRVKYAEDLEELVQCPVCFERPKGQVAMCVRGHHVCNGCRDMLSECPVCKSCFCSSTRNFVVEQLCSKLDEIVLFLLEPTPNSIPMSLSAPVHTSSAIKKSISTQTDNNNQTPTQLADDSVMIIDENALSCCRIGFCQSRLPTECMCHHVSDYHSANLVEAKYCGRDSFGEEIYKDFKLNYDFEKLYDFAVNSKEFGLFFFNVHINKEGDLYFTLQTTNATQENKYSYELAVKINRNSMDYEGLIPTNLNGKKYLQTRKCKKDFFKKFFKNDMNTLNESDKRSFVLSLIIIRI